MSKTALEALITEQLGEILKLHDTVARLNAEVPAAAGKIESFLSGLEARLNSARLEQFISTSIAQIYVAARNSRKEVLNELQSAVALAVRDGWGKVESRGDALFDEAAAAFADRAAGTLQSSSAQVTAALEPILRSLAITAMDLRRERWRTVLAGMAVAAMASGAVTGALAIWILR